MSSCFLGLVFGLMFSMVIAGGLLSTLQLRLSRNSSVVFTRSIEVGRFFEV
jgi:hypothetical protein